MNDEKTPQVECRILRTQRVEIVDASGRPRALLGLSPDGTPVLRLCDEHGTVVWQAPTDVSDGVEAGQQSPVLFDLAPAGSSQWAEVASWSGKSNKTTDTFSVRSPWKIIWETRDIDEDDRGCLFIGIYDAEGEREGSVAGVTGPDRDESVQHKSGTFYLELDTSGQSYRVTILERR